jgi:Icc-related predicted phosphoesterase
MKIAVCSDLHLEFGDLRINNDEDADVLILGGDILIASDLVAGSVLPVTKSVHARADRYHAFIVDCCAKFKHVLMIMGNHEHYHGDFAESATIIRGTFGDLHNFHLLDKEYRIINDVLFFGGTLWTDMNGEDQLTMRTMTGVMNDYRGVDNSNRTVNYRAYHPTDEDPDAWTMKQRPAQFRPEDSVEDHYAFRRALDEVLKEFPQMPAVVVGHHAPSKASTHPRYKKEVMMNGAYSTNLDDFILDRRQIKLWTHGHTHEDFDYRIGTCRIVCNPRGYDGYEDKADTFKMKYVELNPEVTIEYEDDGYHD